MIVGDQKYWEGGIVTIEPQQVQVQNGVQSSEWLECSWECPLSLSSIFSEPHTSFTTPSVQGTKDNARM